MKSFLEIFSSERIRAQNCNKVQNSVFFLQYQYNWIWFCLRCFGFSSNPPPASYISSRRSFVQWYKSWNKEWLFSRRVSWTSRFNMMTINEILSEILHEPKNPDWFLRHLLFLQVETLPYRHEILRWDSLASRWIRVSEWVLGILSLFLIILLNHLPQEIQILHLFWCYQDFFRIQSSGMYFWCIQLFQFFDLSNQNIFFPNSPPAKRCTKSSFILRFSVCQEGLVISQIATAFRRIRPPLIIWSRLQ